MDIIILIYLIFIIKGGVIHMGENKNNSYLQDNNGNYSSLRLMSIISLIASILFGIITIYIELNTFGKSSDTSKYITLFFMINSTCPKLIQKYIEMKLNIK